MHARTARGAGLLAARGTGLPAVGSGGLIVAGRRTAAEPAQDATGETT